MINTWVFFFSDFTGTKHSWGWFQLLREKKCLLGGFCVHNTDKLTAKPQRWIRKHVFPTPLWFISVLQLVNSPRKVFVIHLLHLNEAMKFASMSSVEVEWRQQLSRAFLVQNYDTWWWNNISYSPFKQSSCQDKSGVKHLACSLSSCENTIYFHESTQANPKSSNYACNHFLYFSSLSLPGILKGSGLLQHSSQVFKKKLIGDGIPNVMLDGSSLPDGHTRFQNRNISDPAPAQG